MTALTAADLTSTLDDERHQGWGYATAEAITSRTTRAKLDAAVVAVANEEGLDLEDLFHWSNSKYGRWLVDGVHGRDAAPTRETVRGCLSADIVAGLRAEVGA